MDFHNRRGVYLKKLRPLQKLKNRGFMAFDVETKDGLKGCKLFCWSIAFKGKDRQLHTLQGYEDLAPLFEKIDNSKDKSHPRIIYVHNLGFDVRFVINYCVKHDIKYNALTSGSSVIGLTIPSIGVNFRDSYQFLLSSQEMAEIDWDINEEYRKINCNDLFIKGYKQWTKRNKKRVVRHNANDVLALYEIMDKFRKTMFTEARVDTLSVHSLASLAMKAGRIELPYDLPNPFIYLQFNKESNHMEYAYEEKEEKFVRKSYFGGRTEVFDMNKHENAVYIDRVSMFPSEMHNNKFPIGWGRWIRDSTILQNAIQGLNNLEGFIECFVIPNENCSNYPILPLRMDKKIMYTNCKRTHVYALPELKYAFEMGYKIYPIKGFMFDESDYVFTPFVAKFFKLKANSKGGKKQCAKILLNSYYGKYGQQFERKTPLMHYFDSKMKMLEYVSVRESDGNPLKKFKMSYSDESKLHIIVEIVENITIKPFMNVCMASYTTSYSRVSLIKKVHEMERKQIPVFYVDTDSLTIDNVNIETIPLGHNLGDWDIEQTFESVRFMAPKCYISLREDKKDKIVKPFLKMKGVAKYKIKEICKTVQKEYKKNGINRMERIEELIRAPIELAERYMTYNEAHRRGVILGTKERSKHYSFENHKRNFTNGVSIAWNDATLPMKFKKKAKVC